MKRASFVVLLAAVMILSTSAVAFANTYTAWTSGGANSGSLGTPHADYQLTTEKCAVCHSVHSAPATVPVGATGETELLLRSSAQDACTYCHIDTNTGGKQLYGGVSSAYTVNDDYNHSSIAGCSKCHSVHSANTIGGTVASKILRDGQVVNGANYFYQDEYTTAISWTTTGDEDAMARDVQVTLFCTKCHDNYASASETTVSAYGYDGSGYSTQDVKHHPLKAADANFVAQGASNSGVSVAVAWADATYCRSCHDAGLINQAAGVITNSFPHSTPNNAAFLQVATDAGTMPAAGAGVAINQTTSGAADGACLKCHRDGLGEGAGLSY